jgi:hypothetical protein
VLVSATAAFDNQAVYDLVDLPTVKDELKITDSSIDKSLLRWITQASAQAAKYCDRVFPVQIYQDQFFLPRDYWPAPTVIGGVKPELQLTRWPLAPDVIASPALTPPPLAPVLSSVVGGSLPGATYYGKITYVTPTGETPASLEATLVVGADKLLQVASPAIDTQEIATGWNFYGGNETFGETLQNATPIAIGTPFTLPTSGLTTTGAALPTYVLAIENNLPLAEGVDFLTKFDVGQLVRLDVNGFPRRWPALPILAQYQAGYNLTDPEFFDVIDAVLRIIKGRYFGQLRDPALKQENIEGAYEASYATTGSLSPEVESLLTKYRVPVFG